MTHEIEQNDHYIGGEHVRWTYSIEDNGETKDLTDGSVEWYLLPRRGLPDSDAVLDHTDTGISASIIDEPGGVVAVEIESGTTEEYAGSMMWQRLIVEDGNGDTQIYNGKFPIQER
jgi:hypothetical protein